MEVESWLFRAVVALPERTAVETPDSNCSYEALLSSAQEIARHLAESGAGRGDRVAIALRPGLEFAGALHACMLLGAVAVPVDLRMTERERHAISEGATACLDESMPEELRVGGQAIEADRLLMAARHDLNAPAAIIHTSGTSAAPKPIELTYGNLLWSALGSAVALGLDPRRALAVRACRSRTSAASRSSCARPIYGTTAVVHERFETDARACARCARGASRWSSLVATTLARLLDAGLEHPPALRCGADRRRPGARRAGRASARMRACQ